MKSINFKLNKKLRPYTEIYLDGKLVKPQKKSKKEYIISHSTEKDVCQLEIVSFSRFNSKLWFLMEIFYFLISIFGIFDQRFEKFCYTTHCKVNFKLREENNVLLRVVQPRNNCEAVKVETDIEYQAVENICLIDQKAKKKQKFLKFAKIAVVVIIVAVLVVSFI
ncbi:MAG: hypothetical protein IJW59_02220 [Clostridia bacterium]|nr:hypothetical protein [Clostridia bacterium]